MSIEETRARIVARVRQALAESGIAWSTAQKQQLDALAAEIADRVLLEFDTLLEQMPPPAPRPAQGLPPAARAAGMTQAAAPAAPSGAATPDQEEVLWEGRPFLSIGERYIVTTERVRIVTGVVGKDHEDIELVRLQDVDHTQGIGERILNIGDIVLHSTDRTKPDAVLRNVTNPEQVHEIIRRAMLNARKRYPFIFEQQM